MSEVAIRPGTISDAAAIAVLTGQLGYPSTEGEIAARMETLERLGATIVLVAEAHGAIVGWIAAREDFVIESGIFAEIAGLVVDQDQRGRGIGEALVAAAERWARGRGHHRMRVRSNVVRERAHRFYERLGYALTKRQAVFDKAL